MYIQYVHRLLEWPIYIYILCVCVCVCVCVCEQVMYAGENRLKSLPARFGRLTLLQELDISGCELESLPESLSLCISLIRLWLSNNRWTITILLF